MDMDYDVAITIELEDLKMMELQCNCISQQE